MPGVNPLTPTSKRKSRSHKLGSGFFFYWSGGWNRIEVHKFAGSKFEQHCAAVMARRAKGRMPGVNPLTPTSYRKTALVAVFL
jgi:hypothetical protein